MSRPFGSASQSADGVQELIQKLFSELKFDFPDAFSFTLGAEVSDLGTMKKILTDA